MPKSDKLCAHDIVVAVMGTSGSGKSNFIAKACRINYKEINHGVLPRRPNIQTVTTKHPDDSHRVVLVEVPSLDNPYMSDEAILVQAADWLGSKNAGATFAAIIYLHRITDNRIPHSSYTNLKLFASLCGQAAMQNVILVTSMWDAVEGDVGEQREEELKRIFWKEMLDAGCRTARFENTPESAWRVIGDVKGPRVTLQLQDEMAHGKRLEGTKAYAVALDRGQSGWLIGVKRVVLDFKRGFKRAVLGKLRE